MKKLKKLRIILCCVCIAACSLAFAACGETETVDPDNPGGTTGPNNPGTITPAGYMTVFEFEDLDYTDKRASGLSGAGEGWELVGSPSAFNLREVPESNRPSNDHYAGFTYDAGWTYDFEITASAATVVTMILRMNTEVGTLELGPDQGLGIVVNGVSLNYNRMTVTPGEDSNHTQSLDSFADYAVTGDEITLKAGSNTVSFVILEYAVSRGQAAPLMDCMKLTTQDEEITLTFDNNYQTETNRGYAAD